MRAAILTIIASCSLHAAVTGVVVNKTTGKPQSGVTVTMTKFGAGGMEPAGSVKTDAAGGFKFDSDAGSAHLLQAEYQGVRYSAPMNQAAGAPLEIAVFDSAASVAGATAGQHMIMIESNGEELVVNETVVINNPSRTTWNNPKSGTVKVFVPPAAGENIMARVVAPGSMPVDRQPVKTSAANVWTVDYPVKPGETRFDFSYKLPASAAGVLETRLLNQGATPKLVLPRGIQAAGEGIVSLGTEPSTQASIFDITAKAVKLTISGSGALSVIQSEEEAGPKIKQINPPGYDRNKWWALSLTLAFLTLGFIAHYMKGTAAAGVNRKV
ncbi:MAG: hypothetical protein C0504_02960 [Candidatus Solibacter sp.]|nr:hypothetical protein [Candidatus Solibacter sp.]